jgi:hypothetical protein
MCMKYEGSSAVECIWHKTMTVKRQKVGKLIKYKKIYIHVALY